MSFMTGEGGWDLQPIVGQARAARLASTRAHRVVLPDFRGTTDLHAACPRCAACGTTRVHAYAGGAKCATRNVRSAIRANARQNAKYLQGYTKTCVISRSAGPNDAFTRQKHAFPS
jgi:hypothetical protein